MDNLRCVVGTNSWGSRAYEKAVRGSYVDDSVIAAAASRALELGLNVFDVAEDYGFGYAQKLLGYLRNSGLYEAQPHSAESPNVSAMQISAKFTPVRRYHPGDVRIAFERDCQNFGTSHVDYWWLHLPNDVEQHLAEAASLFHEGRIAHIGVSNFNLEEAQRAKVFLDGCGVPLFGVQNHFSLLDRGEESSGMLTWCRENGLSFWGWAVLEEGVLAGSLRGPNSIMGLLLRRRTQRLGPLFEAMREVGAAHGTTPADGSEDRLSPENAAAHEPSTLTVAQVAIAYCVAKDVVPICGCRKPYQVEQLAEASSTELTAREVEKLERAADRAGVSILKSDIFRFAVRG